MSLRLSLLAASLQSPPGLLAGLGVTPSEGGANEVHELFLFQRGNRAYVTAAVPFSEFSPAGGGGDFRLVDVTDPRNPVQVGEWGAFADAGLAPEPGQEFFGHSATADHTGRTAIVSYWDAGAIFLDISDRTQPTFIGRTIYPAGSDGDTHSIWLARGAFWTPVRSSGATSNVTWRPPFGGRGRAD